MDKINVTESVNTEKQYGCLATIGILLLGMAIVMGTLSLIYKLFL